MERGGSRRGGSRAHANRPPRDACTAVLFGVSLTPVLLCLFEARLGVWLVIDAAAGGAVCLPRRRCQRRAVANCGRCLRARRRFAAPRALAAAAAAVAAASAAERRLRPAVDDAPAAADAAQAPGGSARVVAGLSRSGSTWQFNALRILLQHAAAAAGLAESEVGSAHGHSIDELQPCLNKRVCVVKVHEFMPRVLLQADAVFLTHRDPRDALLSSAQKISSCLAYGTQPLEHFPRMRRGCRTRARHEVRGHGHRRRRRRYPPPDGCSATRRVCGCSTSRSNSAR